ncbi:uncharacterized protein B0T15DRAFT_531800 [Chaetomium strumarium]|uniref:MARVEL domain-containing protein n=1 Tax=Chaetomium strumarium TaxID=1170767 RepID=A0AAJ0GSC9_9PEZI|nr:hypothetical protein B0T15DRAFT_531800 [Chaetomium strumarium]
MQNQPPKYVSPPGTWRTKLALRAASVLFLIIIAGVGGSLAATPRVEMTAVMLLVLVPALLATFIWDAAEAICIWKREGNRGIHPGAVVAIDLFCWLGWAVVDLFLVASGVTSRPRYLIEDYSGYDDYRYTYDPSKVTPEDAQLEKDIMGKGEALVAFVSLTLIVHFVLFVIACYETNIRNRMPRTVYVMQPIYGPPSAVPGGYQPLGSFQGPPPPGPPLSPYQMYMQPPPSPLPTQPSPTHTPELKGGPDRFA